MSMIREFKEFALRGNVVDLAVGVIIGGAFGKIVSSLVSDIVMPPLGVLTGGMDFKDLGVTLRAAEGDQPAAVLRYGMFLQTVLDFLLVALAIFAAIKLMNRLKRQAEQAPPEAPPAPSAQEVLLTEIRDAIRSQGKPQP
jgi:large conductance mechanosensitive channel